MKKQIKLCIGIIAFVIMFYQERPALNVSLFAWLVLVLLFIDHKRRDRSLKWLIASVILASLSFAWYGDLYSFGALFLSLLVIGISVRYRNLNILLYPVTAVVSFLTFPFRIFFFQYWLPRTKEPVLWKKWGSLVLIPALLVSIFLCIYSSGSDLFSRFFLRFSFDFNIPEILFLICLGFLLMFNYWFMFIPRELLKFNGKLLDSFTVPAARTAPSELTSPDIQWERKSGIISLVLLNMLLLVFIITYNYEQFFTAAGKGNLSSEIHQRVATIIGSIAMAIGVIMFYFKSAFSFDPKARSLKYLAIIWIILNTLLICSAITKNSSYIISYGLTFKRIGVYIFLALSLAGLYLTYLKLKDQKTNSFLVSRMVRIFFITFILFSPVNFSWVVTRYNITFSKNDDIIYLRSLDYNKQLLFDTYRNNPDWYDYLEKQKSQIQEEKRQGLLSTKFYYYFLAF